jgi:hypothetical protein
VFRGAGFGAHISTKKNGKSFDFGMGNSELRSTEIYGVMKENKG